MVGSQVMTSNFLGNRCDGSRKTTLKMLGIVPRLSFIICNSYQPRQGLRGIQLLRKCGEKNK